MKTLTLTPQELTMLDLALRIMASQLEAYVPENVGGLQRANDLIAKLKQPQDAEAVCTEESAPAMSGEALQYNLYCASSAVLGMKPLPFAMWVQGVQPPVEVAKCDHKYLFSKKTGFYTCHRCGQKTQ